MNNQNTTIQSTESLSSPKTPSLPGSIELLKQSLNIYKQNLEELLMIIILLTIFDFLCWGYSIFTIISDISIFTKLIIIISIFLIDCIFTLWTFCVIIYLIRDNSKKIDFTKAYRQSFKFILSLLWLYFLGGFMILVAFIFFIIPGIIFGVWFILAPYILVNENIKGMNALFKSREYIRGYWWSIVWRLFVVLILVFIMYILSFFLSFKNIILISKNVDQFINGLISSFLFSLQTIYVFLIYKNLKSIKGEFSFEH